MIRWSAGLTTIFASWSFKAILKLAYIMQGAVFLRIGSPKIFSLGTRGSCS
ncbi:MAG: hypothetical protein BWX59_02344 [Bacteroidetes bacterium ADurb.Bin028]|nr:MAG: hypothetical protein BWX59_02344 [Bacteroidetes bacterium ADurb.Bin028]